MLDATRHVQLDPNKRPRPLVLRVRAGDCLHVTFQNLLAAEPLGTPSRVPQPCGSAGQLAEQTCTRKVGLHIYGMSETNHDGERARTAISPRGNGLLSPLPAFSCSPSSVIRRSLPARTTRPGQHRRRCRTVASRLGGNMLGGMVRRPP
jgi:hypothetical protein